uniref:Double-GTPase 2 domain-containing protein n=1 Tax=uncultured bacterium esnapd2 TaxID=1366601 RepID=S5UBL5_9BACT|nr:hypothetical protein [uncultured bacterium esnapd2]
MQYIVGFFVALFALYIVLWLVLAVLFYVVLPVYVALIPLAVVAGMIVSIVVTTLTLVGAGKHRPATITPDDVTAGTARLPQLPKDSAFGRDWAWPSYLVSQWRVDLATATRGVLGILGRGWRALPRKVGVLMALAAYPVWLAVNVGALFTGVLIAVPWLTFVLVAWLGWLLVVGLLRGADTAIQRTRRSSPSCPACHLVTKVPVFPCTKCGTLHRDVRPGRLGGAWRRCGCGGVLPTTILRAALKIRPVCPRCEKPYRAGAAVLTDIRIPVFGPTSAGKTRLVNAGLVALRDQAAAQGAVTEFVDQESETAYREGADIIASDGDTAKTAPGKLPAITLQIRSGRRKASLHVFDAAGEYYTNRDENADLEFLDYAQGMVFVVDPFSIPWVIDQFFGGTTHPRVAQANPAVDDPLQTYHVTVRRLRDYGIDTGHRSLAIAVVKADLLTGTEPAADLDPGDVKDWLDRAGLDHLVLTAERDFAEVRYFLVASTRAKAEAMSPAAPFVWLLGKSGVDIAPAEVKA